MRFALGSGLLGLTVFGSQLSPFCSVVTTYMRFEGIEHEYIEVEPKKKRQLNGLGTNQMPILVIEDESGERRVVAKAQEIIDEIQLLLLEDGSTSGRGKLDHFTNEQKNECMRMNQTLVPLIGLCRHLTYATSRETVRFMTQYADAWGSWDLFWAQKLIPIFYWRRWRKMGYRILIETGNEEYSNSPPEALFAELEKLQANSKFLRQEEPTVVDVWLLGLVLSMKGETLFTRMEKSCPKTVAWMDKLEERF